MLWLATSTNNHLHLISEIRSLHNTRMCCFLLSDESLDCIVYKKADYMLCFNKEMCWKSGWKLGAGHGKFDSINISLDLSGFFSGEFWQGGDTERKEASKMAGELQWLETAGLGMRRTMWNSAECETCWHCRPLFSRSRLTDSLISPTYEADCFMISSCWSPSFFSFFCMFFFAYRD